VIYITPYSILVHSMSHIPVAWKDVKVESTPCDDIKLDGEKRKRKRNNNAKSSNTVAANVMTQKHHKTNLDTRKQDIHATLDLVQQPIMTDKQEIVKQCANSNAMDIPSNILLKNCIDSHLPVLPMKSETLDKMLRGMTTNLEQIVTESSYRSTLKGVASHNTTYTNDIRKVSKSYEDGFLRQCVTENERPCVRGSECECMFIDVAQPFIGVEYILPWEQKNDARRGMCLPCSRATTQVLFYDIVHSGVHVNGLIQRFYNEHSKTGEYRLSAMLCL